MAERPDPLFDALKRDVRAYRRIVQNHLMRRMQYDMMRYEALDTYVEARRKALYRAAKMSASSLEDSRHIAAMRARLVLDGVYVDVVRDIQLLQKEIRDLAEDNRKALLELQRIDDEVTRRPTFLDSFDVFRDM